MFLRRKKKTSFAPRTLDVPFHFRVDLNTITIPLPDGKIAVLIGNFENISDADANFRVETFLKKLVA